MVTRYWIGAAMTARLRSMAQWMWDARQRRLPYRNLPVDLRLGHAVLRVCASGRLWRRSPWRRPLVGFSRDAAMQRAAVRGVQSGARRQIEAAKGPAQVAAPASRRSRPVDRLARS